MRLQITHPLLYWQQSNLDLSTEAICYNLNDSEVVSRQKVLLPDVVNVDVQRSPKPNSLQPNVPNAQPTNRKSEWFSRRLSKLVENPFKSQMEISHPFAINYLSSDNVHDPGGHSRTLDYQRMNPETRVLPLSDYTRLFEN